MAYAHSGPDWVEIFGPFTLGEGEDALQYAASWPALATEDEREAAGVAEIVEPDTTPEEGMVFLGFEAAIADVDGVPTRVPTFGEAPVPQRVSRMQAKQVLLAQGLLDDVQAAVDGAGDPALTLYWTDASHFHRDHPALIAMTGAVGLTSGQVDDLFVAASQIS